MMAANSEVEMMISDTRKIIDNIEKISVCSNLRYGCSPATETYNNGSLNDSDIIERSILERLAYATDENSSDNVEKLQENTRRASSTGGDDISRILQQLERLILSDDWISKKIEDYGESSQSSYPEFPKKRGRIVSSRLSELGRTLVISSSLRSYINLLGTHHRQSVASCLYGNTSQTLSTLFCTPNNNLHCSEHDSTFADSIKTGIGYAIRLALHDTYGSDYSSKGWRVFLEMGSPVVYISPALHIDLTSYLSTEFSIGDVVILKKSDGAFANIEGRIDHIAFEQQLDDDIAAGKKPLIVIGVVGSAIFGQNDIISRLLETRKSKAQFWIHVVGQGLAALCLKRPSEMQVLSQVDSFTAPLALWLGIPTAPVITLHRPVDNHKLSYHEKLVVLPWWIACHHLTSSKITDIIENAYFLSKMMLRGLIGFPQIEIFGIENPIEFANRVYEGIYTSPTVLIFNYRYPDLGKIKKEKILTANSPSSSDSLTNDYMNSDDANETFVNDSFATFDNDIDNPAEYADSLNFWQLSDALKIIGSTVAAKKRFKKIISEYPSLGLTPVHKWAGVGAVCYIPSIVKETPMNEWNEKQRQQVSHLNLELVHSLRSVDTTFSVGESPGCGVSCVKFGMLFDDKDLRDLVHLVAEHGKKIEQSQKYMDSLAEMIRQGIEAANKDLKRENDARIMQEFSAIENWTDEQNLLQGVIRQIPLMSSLVNWFSPLDKDLQNIKGRSFDLKTGQIQSTDVYYKHRFINQTNAISQDPHQMIAKISNEPVKKQSNNSNSNRDTVQNDNITVGNANENGEHCSSAAPNLMVCKKYLNGKIN
uniref:Pyridoxal-dependent decarboxylase domain-containing protein 1 n=1 Tax=Onchocerca volvulus TaxID=6282 RepID=A0A8R1XUG2_ONCVO